MDKLIASNSHSPLDTIIKYIIRGVMQMQNRFKSVVAWAAISATVILVAKVVFKIQPATATGLEYAINSILAALVTTGILNNPTSQSSF